LLGVVAYNLPTRSVCASMFGEEYVDNVWHMTRLVLPDAALRNSESRLIAGSLRMIEKEHANVWAVVTYAATDAGHIGYVYQATNAIYTGTGGRPTFHTDETGARRGTHLNGHYIDPERAAALGWTLRKGGIKHRYVYILGTKRQRRSRRAMLRFPSLPYPKQ
jgi:adenine modification enzyme